MAVDPLAGPTISSSPAGPERRHRHTILDPPPRRSGRPLRRDRLGQKPRLQRPGPPPPRRTLTGRSRATRRRPGPAVQAREVPRPELERALAGRGDRRRARARSARGRAPLPAAGRRSSRPRRTSAPRARAAGSPATRSAFDREHLVGVVPARRGTRRAPGRCSGRWPGPGGSGPLPRPTGQLPARRCRRRASDESEEGIHPHQGDEQMQNAEVGGRRLEVERARDVGRVEQEVAVGQRQRRDRRREGVRVDERQCLGPGRPGSRRAPRAPGRPSSQVGLADKAPSILTPSISPSFSASTSLCASSRRAPVMPSTNPFTSRRRAARTTSAGAYRPWPTP